MRTPQLAVPVVAILAACSFQPGVLGSGDASEPSDASDGAVGPSADAPDGALGAARKKTITIDPDDVTGNLTDFPVWFVIDDASELGARALADGSDIFFTLPDGTDLAYERVRWNQATGHLEAWVRLDLSDTQPTLFELHYGDPGPAHPPDPPTVFSAGFAAVWHFDDALTATAVTDARNQYAGTTQGGMDASDSVAGRLGRGFDFDGVNDEVSFTNMLVGSGSHTISAWIKVVAPTTGFGSIVTVGNSSQGASRWMHSDFTSSNQLSVGFYGPDFADNTNVSDDTWTLVHWVWDDASNTSRVFENATEVDSDTTSMTINTQGAGGHIGNAPQAWGPGGNTTNPIDGIMDELRISTVPRSAGWIATEHANQRASASFYTIGAEEILP